MPNYTGDRTQSLFNKSNFGKKNEKVCKSRHQTFLDLSNFTEFLNVALYILRGFVELATKQTC